MVFYFTGTGNSLYIAKRIEASPISIPQIIQKLYSVVEQCMPYIGYPRTLNAMSIIDEVADKMESQQA